MVLYGVCWQQCNTDFELYKDDNSECFCEAWIIVEKKE